MMRSANRMVRPSCSNEIEIILLCRFLQSPWETAALAASRAIKRCRLERPVQVQRIDFTNENPAREFVSVVRARHETDLDFRVAGTLAIAPSLMPQFAA